MSQIRIQSTIPLTPYAQLNNLSFASVETPPQAEILLETRKTNCFSKCVKKLDNLQSEAAICCRAIFILALTISIVGIPFLIFWKSETNLNARDRKTQEVALETLNMQNKQWNKRAEIKENLGIENFENIPSLDLQGRMGSTDYIDFLMPQDLSSPIMKGLDKFKRPFISIKMKEISNPHTFVITLFQRYTNQDSWTWIGAHGFNALSEEIHENLLTPIGEQVFKQIIQGTHPKFTLAN